MVGPADFMPEIEPSGSDALYEEARSDQEHGDSLEPDDPPGGRRAGWRCEPPSLVTQGNEAKDQAQGDDDEAPQDQEWLHSIPSQRSRSRIKRFPAPLGSPSRCNGIWGPAVPVPRPDAASHLEQTEGRILGQ